MKHILTLFLILLAAPLTFAERVQIGDLYYNLDSSSSTAEVTYLNPSYSNDYYVSGDLKIPESVSYDGKSYSVTSIGERAFYNCYRLKNVIIPNSVISIGDVAFCYCGGLTSVTIGNSVTSIGSNTFRECRGLTSVEIPNSVTSIGDQSFYWCSGLTSVIIPNSVTSIGYSAFSGCRELTSVEIPNSVTLIGNSAFSGCSGLSNMTIPNSVTFIGGSTFSGCTGLKSVKIPNTVTYIGNGAFRSCSGLRSVIIPNSVTSIGDEAFSGCSGLKSMTIPNSVTFLGDGVFYRCTGLNSVKIPNSVTSIGYYAFRDCSALKSIEIPNSVISIGRQAFKDCWGLKSIEIPNSVTSIGHWAFEDCIGLKSVKIPNTITSIGISAFEDCNSLTNVEITDISAWCCIDFSDISANPLYYAGNLTVNGEPIYDLVVPEGIEEIKNYAFVGLESFNSIYLPSSLKKIGVSSFEECPNLKKLVFNSQGLLNIGSKAFSECKDISMITCNTVRAPVSDSFDVFADAVYSNAVLYVPEKDLSLYYSMVPWSKFYNINSIGNVTGVEILAQGASTISIGTSTRLILVSNPEGVSLTGAVWTSSNPEVATVDTSGLVEAKAEGSATITATYGDFSASCQITVTTDMSIIIDPVMTPDESPVSIFNLNGQLVKCNASQSDIDALTPGIYIIGGKKIIKR